MQHPPQNIPRSDVVKFIGRSKELEALHDYLQQTEENAIATIVGMAGVGKTELAIQYAQNYWQKFYVGGVCWLRATSKIATQIIDFVQIRMGLLVPQSLEARSLNEEQQVEWCWLYWQLSELPVLVVIDDVTDYIKY